MTVVQGRCQDSQNGQGIPYAFLKDNMGNTASADAGGFWFTQIAYPGYMLSCWQSGYGTTNHTFTAQDCELGWVTILMTKDTITHDGNGDCWASEALTPPGARRPAPPATAMSALSMARRLVLTPSAKGSLLLAYYANHTAASDALRILKADPELRQSLIGLIADSQPFVRGVLAAAAPPHRQADVTAPVQTEIIRTEQAAHLQLRSATQIPEPDQPISHRLDPELAGRAITLIDSLTEAARDERLRAGLQQLRDLMNQMAGITPAETLELLHWSLG